MPAMTSSADQSGSATAVDAPRSHHGARPTRVATKPMTASNARLPGFMPSTAVRMIGRTAASYDLRVGSSATGSTTAARPMAATSTTSATIRNPRVVSISVDLMPSRRATPGEPQRPPNDATSQWPAPAPCPTAPCPSATHRSRGAKPTRLRLPPTSQLSTSLFAISVAARPRNRSSPLARVVAPRTSTSTRLPLALPTKLIGAGYWNASRGAPRPERLHRRSPATTARASTWASCSRPG